MISLAICFIYSLKVRSRSCPLLTVLSYLNYPSICSEDLIFDVLKQKERGWELVHLWLNVSERLQWKMAKGNIDVGDNLNGHMFVWTARELVAATCCCGIHFSCEPNYGGHTRLILPTGKKLWGSGPCDFFARPVFSALTVFKERKTRYQGILQTYQIDNPSKLVIKSDVDDVTRLDHGPNVMMVTVWKVLT